jgi:release factor glutamine methyltransferase
VERFGVADRVSVRHADLFEGIDGPFDLITGNPPYVRELDRRGLQPEVRDHEPAVALFGASDGLGLIRRVVEEAPPRLRVGGYLVFEFGFGQDEDIEALIAARKGLRLIDLKRDLQGIARTAVAIREG